MAEDEQWLYQSLIDGIEKMQLEIKSVTLTCDKTSLVDRWNHDQKCEWRTQEWLAASMKSLPYFASLRNRIDTSNLTINEVAARIMLE